MIQKLVKWVLLCNLAFLFATNVYASIPNNDNNPTSFVGPTIQGRYTIPLLNTTTPFWSTTGVSVLGEAGPKNLRVGGTIGFGIDSASRIKFTGEFLWQELQYSFFTGNTNRWVQQGAIGGTYQADLFNYFDFLTCYLPQFDLNAYYSHAPNKTLSTVNGNYTNADGTLVSFTEQRRIAGSDAYAINPGLRIHPWMGAQARAFLNYDNVNYHKKYSPGEDASGFGGTVGFNQTLFNNLNFDVFASIRKPFNEYGGSLNYLNYPFFGLWTVGLFGNYIDGKNTLPNAYNIGLSLNYFVEPCCLTGVLPDYKNEHGRRMKNGDPASIQTIAVSNTPDKLVTWIADPAVYIPQVLAVPDSQVTLLAASCSPTVLLVSSIPEQTVDSGSTVNRSFNLPFAQFFSGTAPITFSMVSNIVIDAGAGPVTTTLNPTTGVITVFTAGFTQATITITLTGTNACGSASSTFIINLQSD